MKTIQEAILKSLEKMKTLTNYIQIYEHILENHYYDFGTAKTPKATISALLGNFIRKNDTRVKRIKYKGGYLYYLSKYEQDIDIEKVLVYTNTLNKQESLNRKNYYERDLHKLLSSYLKNQNIYAKTIFHKSSKNSVDNYQKWVHPDLIGIKFLKLSSKVNNAFIKSLNKEDIFKITSYELKREINTDYELKKSYFQAVSNSSWSNYGYLVAKVKSYIPQSIRHLILRRLINYVESMIILKSSLQS